ncbi:MAG: hypothetical protein WBL68_19115 [Nitrososphaeraceae archaeon]
MYKVFIAVRVFLYIKGESIGAEVEGPKLDAYLEEELYDTLVYCIQNLKADDFETKMKRAEEIGRELYSDGGVDAMENMFYSIEFRVKDEIGQDAKPYRSWWNGISNDWKY